MVSLGELKSSMTLLGLEPATILLASKRFSHVFIEVTMLTFAEDLWQEWRVSRRCSQRAAQTLSHLTLSINMARQNEGRTRSAENIARAMDIRSACQLWGQDIVESNISQIFCNGLDWTHLAWDGGDLYSYHWK
jgi:hypothetical protein